MIISKDKIESDLVIFKYQSDSKSLIRYIEVRNAREIIFKRCGTFGFADILAVSQLFKEMLYKL